MELPDWTILGNSLRSWLIAVALAAVLALAAKAIVLVVIRRLRVFAGRTATQVDDLILGVLERTRLPLLAVLAVYAATTALTLPAVLAAWLRMFAVFALLIQVGFWLERLVTLLLLGYEQKNLATDAGRVTTMRAAGFIIRLVLFSLILLMALDNVPGLDITTLIAGLGIGGIAVALAAQNILGDLFASLSIALDKPFVIGDVITVDGFTGTVEDIGLKTTRLRSVSGEQLIFANNDLLASRVRNFKRMTERRAVFTFGVVYATPPDRLEAIPGMVREIVEAQPLARLDRAHFKAVGPSSLDFEVAYFVSTPDYGPFMDTQQAINLALVRRFAAEDIAFAYPTQTLLLERPPRPRADARA